MAKSTTTATSSNSDFECQTESSNEKQLLESEIEDLKNSFEMQKQIYEHEIARLVENNSVTAGDNRICESTSNTNISNRSSSNLEAQLKYCHEKCENVVVKLSQLKKQNESLNNKIKSIKSSMVVN